MNYTCLNCNKEFKSKKKSYNRTPKYCSLLCYGETLKLNKRCKLCNNIIQNKNSVSIKNRVYCSKDCQSKARKNIPLSNEWKLKLSEGRKNSDKCKGSNLYNWKGGKDTIKIRIKESFYKRKYLLRQKLNINFLNNLIIEQNNKCFYCESDLTNYKAIEHLTPVSKGGDNYNYNIVYSCKNCNSKKRVNTLEEYVIKNNKYYLLDKWDMIYAGTLLRMNNEK